MQIRGKIFTIIGIVLIFGYFISDSLKDPYDPTQVVLIGNDTLGRDWSAFAEANAKQQFMQSQVTEGSPADAYTAQQFNLLGYGIDSNGNYTVLEDPFKRQKFNQDNYATIQSPDGREIVVGYSRDEETENEDNEENFFRKIKTRHQTEIEEPEMRYKD